MFCPRNGQIVPGGESVGVLGTEEALGVGDQPLEVGDGFLAREQRHRQSVSNVTENAELTRRRLVVAGWMSWS